MAGHHSLYLHLAYIAPVPNSVVCVCVCVCTQGVTSWFVFYLIKEKGVEDAAQVSGAHTHTHTHTQ